MHRLKRKEEVVIRNIHGVFFLINIKENYYDDKCILYEINEVGSFIWNHINECSSVNDMVSLLKEAINDDVDDTVLKDDIEDFLKSLLKEGFLKE